jgi:hypothetical protein
LGGGEHERVSMAKRGLFDWQYVLLWCGVAAAAAIFWLDPIRRLAISGQQLVGFMIIGLYVYARFIHDDLKKKRAINCLRQK